MKDQFDFDEGVFTHSQTFVNGVNLHYVTGGQCPLLLLWHGFLGSWFSWRKVMPKLAKNYTVIVPDMRGFGDSDKPETGFDTATLAEDFRALIKEDFGGQKVILMAHDMGAPPALIYAGSYPDKVTALVYFENPALTMKNMQQLHQFTP